MKRILAGVCVVAALALSGCQDNTSLKRAVDSYGEQIAMLKDEVAKLQRDNAQLGRELKEGQGATGGVDPSIKENAEIVKLKAANARLEGRLAGTRRGSSMGASTMSKPVTPADTAETPAHSADIQPDDRSYLEYKANKEREAREAQEKLEARMNELATVAKGYGLEFDPKDPEGSVRKIMANSESRQKAIDAAHDYVRKQRYAKVGLDDSQSIRVQQIEDETRKKISDVWRSGRDNKLPREETQKQIEQAVSDGNSQVKGLLTEDQYKTYTTEGGVQAGGGGFGGMGDIGKLFEGVKIEGGGWGGRGGDR